MKIPKLYISTAGWFYNDWVPNFYSKRQSKNFDWLEFYSQYFNAVEVNSTYYTYVSRETVEGWLKKTESNDDFLFTIKLHQDFTHKHFYTIDQIKAVKHNLDILKSSGKLGGLLFQFPYSFYFNNVNVDYLQRLIETFEEYNKFIEVRHKSWQNKNAKSVTFCTIDQPQIGETIKFNPIVGNKMMYIRFHGSNTKAWKKSLNDFGKKQTFEARSSRY
ncbi:MAG TPA: DUF72 domain-containing protein, partial [Ignavibacteria bacterium]|nr:DUF72 domain-containing protein [Ignavibacteria bacterium]